MIKVLRNTNFKLNNGFLDYGDVAEIEVETTQLATRTLQYGDIILEKSGGSDTQAIGRVVLFDKTDNETYSYSNFCSRIRVLNVSEVEPLYLWIVLHDFYCKGGTLSLQNGIRLLNTDMNGYSKIKIPVPPIDVQKQIVEEIGKIEKRVIDANATIEANKAKIEELIEISQRKKIDMYRLSNSDMFSITIGKRVLNANLIPNGKLPVYSANVIAPFGYINDDIIKDFSTPSILWGIDGDWMVNYIPSNTPFYPTDHCGVLRVLHKNISAKYLSFIINRAGRQQGFCRKLRASIDRISGLSVELPNYNIQTNVVSKIEVLELTIKNARAIIENAAKEKQAVLDKYL